MTILWPILYKVPIIFCLAANINMVYICNTNGNPTSLTCNNG